MLAVGLVLAAIIFIILFAVIRKTPRSWWLWGTAATGLLLVLIVMVAPVFIAPLFNKYEPMAAGPLREQIIAMAQSEGIPADNVYVFDASKQTKRISANVSGIGPTIRISLNDNLLNRATPGGVKAVMGHEMGHYTLGQVPRLAFYFTLVAMVGLFILWWATPQTLRRYGSRWGVTEVSDPAVAPLFSIIFAVFGLLVTPLLNTIIRVSEAEADAYGVAVSKEPDGFASVAMLSSEYRKIDPGKWEERLFYDHPSPRTRVRMAMEWKARHLDELPADQRGIIVMTPEAKAN
jgi:STE24 endopeptidase